MDAFELMGKVSRKGGGCGWGQRGARGAGTRLCRAPAWGLRACRGVRGGCVRAVACVGVACVPGKGAPGATAEGHRGERAWVEELRV